MARIVVPDPFMILLKQQYINFHTLLLIVLYLPFQRNETLQVAKLKRTWNLAPVFQIVQKIPENYCPCLFLSIGQVW